MNATLLINGEVADLQSFIQSIVQQTVAAVQTAQVTKTPEFVIDPARIYNLSNPELVRYLGYEKQKRPQTAIAREMRKMGISPIATIRRNGMSVMGLDVINYLTGVRKNQKKFTSKN